MQAKGSRAYLALGFEDNRENEAPIGSGVLHLLPFVNSSLKSSQNMIDSSVIRLSRNASAPSRGNIEVSGSMTIPMDQRNLGYLLRAMFGRPLTTLTTMPATLFGGRGVTVYFDQWQRILAGSLQIKVDSASPIDVTGIDLSAVTTFAEIAQVLQSAIQAEIPGIIVKWDDKFHRFMIQSPTAAKLHALTLAATGQALAPMLKMTSTEGAIAKEVGPLYTHVFKVQDEQPSLCFEQGFADIKSYHLFTGCKVQKFSFSSQGDSELTASLEILGSKESLSTAPYDPSPLAPLKESPFGNFQAFITKDGDVLGNATQVDVEVDYDLDGDTTTLSSGGYRTGINEGIVKPSGKIICFFENQEMIAAAIEGQKSSLSVSYAQGPHALVFEMPEVEFERNTPGIDGPKGIRLEMGYKAYYDENPDETAIKVTLVNDVASY